MFTSRLLMVWRWALLILILGLMAKENGSAQSTPTLLRKIGLGTLTYSALSPDGTKILTCTYDGFARLWDSTSGQLLWSNQYMFGACTIAGFSNDGKKMITGSIVPDVWDVATKNLLGKLSGHTFNVDSISFSADGKTVVTGSSVDNTARTWNLGTCTALKTISAWYASYSFQAIACSPDASRLLAFDPLKGLYLFDTATSKFLRQPNIPMYQGRQHLMYSPDGKSIALGVYPDKVQLWNTSMTQSLATYSGHSGPILAVAFSADGTRLASGSLDGTARLWDVATSQTLKVFLGHSGGIVNIGISTDKKKILTGSSDQTVRIWNADTGAVQQTLSEFLPDQGPVCFTPDGTAILVFGSGNQWCLRDVNTGQVLRKYPVSSISGTNPIFSPDGTKILTKNNKEADVWDAKTGKLLHALRGHTQGILCCAFSPDNSKVLTGSYDNTARIWDIATSQTLQTFPGNITGNDITAVAFSPDGGRIAIGGLEGIVKIRNIATGEEMLSIPNPNPSFQYQNTVKALVFSPDGARVIAGYLDGTRVWNAANGQKLNEYLNYRQVNSISVSPDGCKVLIASHVYYAKLWDLITGDILQTYSGQRGEVYATFSPDGNKVLTSSSEGTIWLWATMPTQAREWSRYE